MITGSTLVSGFIFKECKFIMIPNKEGDYSYCKYKKRCNYPKSLIDKEKAIIADGLSCFAPLFNERSNYNAMIEYMTTIRKLVFCSIK